MQYDIDKLVESASDFTCKPQVVTRVENLLLDPMVSFSELAKVISMDPGLAARALGFSEERLTELESVIKNRVEEEKGLFD